MNQPVDPFAELQRSKEALQDGFALLDEGSLGESDEQSAGRAAAWQQVAARFTTCESPEALRDRVAPERLAEFDEELAEVIRLNAVLIAAVASEQGTLLGRVRAVRESRRVLGFYGSVATEGERCDISG